MLRVGGVEATLPVIVNNYEFLEVIGRGGFGAVYRCLNRNYGVEFAAKVLPMSSASASESFTSEIEALTQLDHPNVIKLYNYFEFEQQLILILELCEGGSIKNKIRGGIERQEFLYYANQILDGLDAIHAQRIAHRDIKPANLLLNDRGKVKVSDFGISAQVTGQIHDFTGSLFFMAPEVLAKTDYDPFAADVWALGITFFHMITGKLPWTAETKDEVKKQIRLGCIDLKEVVNSGFKMALKKMLSMDPRERPTMAQVKQMSAFQASLSRGVIGRPPMRSFIRRSLSGASTNSSVSPSRSGVGDAVLLRKSFGSQPCLPPLRQNLGKSIVCV